MHVEDLHAQVLALLQLPDIVFERRTPAIDVGIRFAGARLALARGQIVASRERAPHPFEDHAVHARVVIRFAQRRVQLALQRNGECVQLLRTVQDDPRPPLLDFVDDIFVIAHRSPPARRHDSAHNTRPLHAARLKTICLPWFLAEHATTANRAALSLHRLARRNRIPDSVMARRDYLLSRRTCHPTDATVRRSCTMPRPTPGRARPTPPPQACPCAPSASGSAPSASEPRRRAAQPSSACRSTPARSR